MPVPPDYPSSQDPIIRTNARGRSPCNWGSTAEHRRWKARGWRRRPSVEPRAASSTPVLGAGRWCPGARVPHGCLARTGAWHHLAGESDRASDRAVASCTRYCARGATGAWHHWCLCPLRTGAGTTWRTGAGARVPGTPRGRHHLALPRCVAPPPAAPPPAPPPRGTASRTASPAWRGPISARKLPTSWGDANC